MTDVHSTRGTPRLVVFFGNCQAHALRDIYARYIAGPRDEQVAASGPHSVDDALISRADVFVEQVFSGQPCIEPDKLKPHATHVRFPVMLAQFLWPFSGQPHVMNESHPFQPAGPYPDEMGDSFLNRLIGTVPEDDAFERYVQLDIATHAGLDRLLDIHLEQQRLRDRIAGIDIAGFIDARFRTEALFSTRGHPGKRLLDHVARIVFTAIGVPDRQTELALASNAYSPFAAQELPIHPNLAAHYGLRYVAPTTCYRYHEEGRFTFAQYVRRYLRYEWNRPLAEALYLGQRADPNEVLPLLDRALLTSPRSPAGLSLKANLHLRLGNAPAARAAVLGAIAAMPDFPDWHAQLASVAQAQGDLLAAEAALCTAIALLPGTVRFHQSLADLLLTAGRDRDAADVLTDLVAQTPSDAGALRQLAWTLRSLSDLPAAEAAFRDAIEADPGHDEARIGLVNTLNEQGRQDESLTILRAMAAAGSQNPEPYVYLGNLLWARSDLDGAEKSFSRAIELAPNWIELNDVCAAIRRAKLAAGTTVAS